jgi:hypothetical protein
MPQELVALQPDLHDHAPMRTSLFIILALAACSSDPAVTPDAKPVSIDAPAPSIDAAPTPVTLDCNSYCTEVQANCKDTNAQYPDMAHCLGACKGFTAVGALTDTTGDTLGCRIYHAGTPAAGNPTLHCPHAGPGGDQLSATAPAFCSGGNVCQDFCSIEVKTCGTTAAPITGVTPQYADNADCLAKCGAFPNKTANFSVGAKGDSLACRLYHVTNAAALTDPVMITAHCGHSGPNGGANQATCMTGTAP